MKKNNMGHGIKKLITKKRVLIAATVVTVSGIAVFATMAQLSGKSNDKENPFAPMTITDIQIEEPSGTDYVMDHNDTVKTKQVMINNPAGEAKKPVFIRVKVVPSVKNAQGAFTDGQVEIDQTATQISEDWLYDSGYYYYQLPLAAGQTAENLIESFSLPKAWDMKGYTELDGHIDAFAEAVQYENFKPQLNAQGQIVGWNDIVIENAVDRLPQQEEIQGDTGTSVIYQLGAEKFVTLPDEDLFKGFKGLMPGDTRTQVIHIGNEDEKTSFIYLYALQADEDAFESAEQKAISDELMQLLTVTITNEKDDSVIYSGKLYGEEGSFSMYGEAQAICLGGFAQGESADLTVELQVPTELNNRYADAVGKIKWIFTCSQEDPPVEQPTQPPTEPMTEPATQPSTEPMTEPATQPTNPPKAPDIVTTGDIYTVPVLAAAAAATAAILAIAVLLIKRRKKNSMRE